METSRTNVKRAKGTPVRCGRGSRACLPVKRLIRSLALAALISPVPLGLSAVSAQDAQPVNADHISGTVISSVTHEPIGRALVMSPDERFATMTDDYGRFEFTFPQSESGQSSGAAAGAPGTLQGNNRPYALIARKPGFLAEPDDTGRSAQAIQSGKDVTIPLVPEGLIVGHVVLPSGEASDRIQVEVYHQQIHNGRARWIPLKRETTRFNGDFRFAELSAGSYKLFTRESMDRDPQASAPGGQLYGFAPVYFPNAKDFGSAGTIQLIPGKVAAVELQLVRQPYYPIKVPVANVPPAAQLGVNVSLQRRGGPGYALGYDPREQAITGMLPSGSYDVEVASYGPAAVSGSLNITVNGPLQGPVMVVVPDSPIAVNVKEEFTSKEGTGPGQGGAVYINGQPTRRIVNVNLEPVDDFNNRGGPSLRPPSGPEDDSMVLENVQPGRYWVHVYAARGYASSVTSGTVDLQHQPLVVAAGVSTAPIEITLRDDTAQIEGVIAGVNNPSGASPGTAEGLTRIPSPSAHVYCVPLPDRTGTFADVYVQPDGKFISPPLPPGEYRLLAFPRPQTMEYENPEAMRVYEGKGRVVRLSAGQTEHVQLQLIQIGE